MTIICYDTEFLEDGRTIEFISIGMATPDGREYYAVNHEAPYGRVLQNDWLRDNVWRNLPVVGYEAKEITVDDGESAKTAVITSKPGDLDYSSPYVKPKWVIRNEVRAFILATENPELWADHGAYDHVVLAQLFGKMIDLPDGIPMFTNDLQTLLANQIIDDAGEKTAVQIGTSHNALDDAKSVLATMRLLGAV